MKGSWLLAAILALVGCGKGESGARMVEGAAGTMSEPPMLPARTPLPECPDLDFTPCDIRTSDCQARMIDLACCMRGSDPVSDVTIELISEGDYAAVLMDDFANYPPQPTHYDRAASVLRMALAEGVSKMQAIKSRAERIFGQYRSAEKRLLVIDHGVPDDMVQEDTNLVHEYVHALQDADYDLQHWPQDVDNKTFDGFMATDSVIEGEAAFYEVRAAVPLLGINISAVDFHDPLQTRLDEYLGGAFLSPTPIGASYTSFPYAWGAPQAFEAWRKGGPRGIDPLWASPPANTQRILSQLSRINVPQPTGTVITEPSVTTLTLDSQDTWGAWGLELFYYKAGVTTGLLDQALTWRGDHFWVYTDDGGDATYALWQVELDGDAAATTLEGKLADISGVEHGTQGARVFASFGFAAASAELTAAGNAWLTEH
jgi:hypothetical protein